MPYGARRFEFPWATLRRAGANRRMTRSQSHTAVKIESFRPEHTAAFEALNRAWLVGHGLLEPADEPAPERPERDDYRGRWPGLRCGGRRCRHRDLRHRSTRSRRIRGAQTRRRFVRAGPRHRDATGGGLSSTLRVNVAQAGSRSSRTRNLCPRSGCTSAQVSGTRRSREQSVRHWRRAHGPRRSGGARRQFNLTGDAIAQPVYALQSSRVSDRRPDGHRATGTSPAPGSALVPARRSRASRRSSLTPTRSPSSRRRSSRWTRPG